MSRRNRPEPSARRAMLLKQEAAKNRKRAFLTAQAVIAKARKDADVDPQPHVDEYLRAYGIQQNVKCIARL